MDSRLHKNIAQANHPARQATWALLTVSHTICVLQLLLYFILLVECMCSYPPTITSICSTRIHRHFNGLCGQPPIVPLRIIFLKDERKFQLHDTYFHHLPLFSLLAEQRTKLPRFSSLIPPSLALNLIVTQLLVHIPII